MRYYTYVQDLLHIIDNPRAPRIHRIGSDEVNRVILGPTSSITDMPKADLQDNKTSDMDLQDSQDSKTSDMDFQDSQDSRTSNYSSQPGGTTRVPADCQIRRL